MHSAHANLRQHFELSRILTTISGKYCVGILMLLSDCEHPLRFNELRHALGGIACKSLSATLKKLEQEQLVLRTEYFQLPPRVEYSLTNAGKALIPVLTSLHVWSEIHASSETSD